MAIKNWRECAGVNKTTGRVKPGWKAVRGKCPVSTHHQPSVSDLVSSGAASATSLGRARRRRKTLGSSAWKTRVFNTHHAAQGFLNRIKKRHAAVIEEHGASQWRVAYLPAGRGMPLNRSR